jgi:hypothetical protein
MKSNYVGLSIGIEKQLLLFLWIILTGYSDYITSLNS